MVLHFIMSFLLESPTTRQAKGNKERLPYSCFFSNRYSLFTEKRTTFVRKSFTPHTNEERCS